MKDKQILDSTSWLKDGIIFAAQSLLSLQSKGKILGWQLTKLSKRNGLFKSLPSGPFVQVLHVSNCHWAVASNIDVHSEGGFHNDIVSIYDSARPSEIADSVKRAICSFFKCTSHGLFIMWMHWQGMGACWLHCRGPTHHVSLWNAGFGSCSGL